MLNKVMLIGNVGRDPEVRYTQNGTAVANLSVATSRKWKGQDGQMQEETEWHKVTAWGRLAELCNEYLHKGSRVYVEGRLQTRKWQDQDGNDRYQTEVVAQEIRFLDGVRGGNGSGNGGRQPQQQGIPGASDQPSRPGHPGNPDDVPF